MIAIGSVTADRVGDLARRRRARRGSDLGRRVPGPTLRRRRGSSARRSTRGSGVRVWHERAARHGARWWSSAAGVVGLAVAYELGAARPRGPRPGPGRARGVATRAAAGMLAPTSEADLTDRRLVDLELDSLAAIRSSSRRSSGLTGESCGYRTEGTLWVALDRDQNGDLERLLRDAAREGSCRAAADGGGGAGPGAAPVRPHRRRAARRRATTRSTRARWPWRSAPPSRASGGQVVAGCRVDRVEHAGNEVVAVSGRSVDERTLRVQRPGRGPCRRRLERGRGRARFPRSGCGRSRGSSCGSPAPELIRHVVRSPDVYLVPRRGGELLVGATMEEQGLDARPKAGRRPGPPAGGLAAASRRDDLAVSELSVGFRPALRDHLPVIGAAATQGLYVATGHFRNGVLLAPATAHHLAEWIVGGSPTRGARAVRARAAGDVGRVGGGSRRERNNGAGRRGDRGRTASAARSRRPACVALLGALGYDATGRGRRRRPQRRDRAPGGMGNDAGRAG